MIPFNVIQLTTMPYLIVKTQRNSTQLKATQKQLRWVRHSTHLEPTPPHPTPPQTFQALLDQLES